MDEKNIPQGPKLSQEEIDKLVKKMLKEKKAGGQRTEDRKNPRDTDRS